VRNKDIYNFGKGFFFVSITICTVFIIFNIFYSIHNNTFLLGSKNTDMYNSGLGLIFSIIGILFAIIIFLIQNTNQEYSSNFSKVIFSNKYFVITLFYIFIISIYNIICVYFQLAYPFDLISLILSINVICLIISMIIFTGYFLNIENIIDFYTERIIKKTRKWDFPN